MPRPAEQPADSHPERGGDRALRDRARDGDAPDGEQLVEVELQADAEHQQDDADFGELLGHVLIGDEARRVRADEEAGEQIADDRREAEPLGREAQQARRAEPAGQRENQIDRMHRPIFSDLAAIFRVGSCISTSEC